MDRQGPGIADEQRQFLHTKSASDVDVRVEQLRKLRRAIAEHEQTIVAALKKDLAKPDMEAYTSEIFPVYYEIDKALKEVRSWARPEKVRTPFSLFPASSFVYPEPYGSVLIVAPWNYPFRLAMMPLVGALAAGNCVVLKPSEVAPFTSKAIADALGPAFDRLNVAVVEGGVAETQDLLAQRFDFICFTGGTRVGRIVMEAAAKHLTPVLLELGGKNPCIVDDDIDVKKTADRIVWGKFFNAGQTCLAPDYLLVQEGVKERLMDAMLASIRTFYGDDPSRSPDYARIINEAHFRRLEALMKEGKVIAGGAVDEKTRYIAPTVIDGIGWNDEIMAEEIFGPLLPVMTYGSLDEVVRTLREKPKPLALYFFSRNRERQERVLKELSSGGANINDTMAHIQNQRLPFGGVGESGMGAYQGRASFEAFSHRKAVVKRSFRADPRMKYPPYRTPVRYMRRMIKFLY